MPSVQWMMKRIQCKRTTELGHDEVYYLAPACFLTPKGGQMAQILPAPPAGPDAARGGNAGGPAGANTAWDCNDSGSQADLTFGGNGVGLFNVTMAPGDVVNISLTLMESDGWSWSEVTDVGAKVAEAILTAVGEE